MKKPKRKPLIPCSCCNGTGSEPMEDGMWQTLRRTSTRKTFCAADLLEPGIGQTAINNRLRRLAALGFVAFSHRVGKTKHYIRHRYIRRDLPSLKSES